MLVRFMTDLGKPPIVIAAIGHTEDGKTTLASAITHVLANEPGHTARPLAVEELDQIPTGQLPNAHPRLAYPSGTIHPGVLAYESPSRRYAQVDCPGRRKLIRSTARFVANCDAVILVVSAVDGVRAQTREHVAIARGFGIGHMVVFLNKCDLVADPDEIDTVERDVRAACYDYGFDGDGVRVIRGSARLAADSDVWRSGILALVEALDSEVTHPALEPNRPALLCVDEVFGQHTREHDGLIAGRLLRGTVATNEQYELSGLDAARAVTLQSIEIFGQRVPEARAGEMLGAFLLGPNPDPYVRGQVLTPPGGAIDAACFEAEIELLRPEQGGRHTPIFPGHHAQFHIGAAAVTGELRWPPPSGLRPGERMQQVRVTLVRSTFVEAGMPFVFRDGCDGLREKGSGPRWSGTAGTGTVTRVLGDVAPLQQRRGTTTNRSARSP